MICSSRNVTKSISHLTQYDMRFNIILKLNLCSRKGVSVYVGDRNKKAQVVY